MLTLRDVYFIDVLLEDNMEFKNTQLRDSSLKTAGIINDLNIKQMLLPSVSAILWDGDVVEMSLYFRKEVVVV